MVIVIQVNKAAHSQYQLGSDNEGSWEPKSDEEAIEIVVDDGVVQKDIQACIVEEVPPHLIVYKISARLMNL